MMKIFISMAFGLATCLSAYPAAANNQYYSELNRASADITRGNYHRALSTVKPLAKQGVARAQFLLANMYHEGQGVPLSHEVCIHWYTEAANQAHTHAQYKLGMHYEKGLGTDQDSEEAKEWIRLAAEDGHVEAQDYMGYKPEEEPVRGPKPISRSELALLLAKNGDQSAQFFAGQMYHFGKGGVEQDHTEAIKWYEKAAAQGSTHAMVNLGSLYIEGIGVEPSPERGAELFLQAAEAGSHREQSNIAKLYMTGQGIQRNVEEGIRYMKLAAIGGEVAAQTTLGKIYGTEGTPIYDMEASIKWLNTAADRGDARAIEALVGIEDRLVEFGLLMHQAGDYDKALRILTPIAEVGQTQALLAMGTMYYYGQGVAADEAMAIDWLSIAAEQGSQEAQYRLGRVYQNSHTAAGISSQAQRYFQLAADQGCRPAQDSLETLGDTAQDRNTMATNMRNRSGNDLLFPIGRQSDDPLLGDSVAPQIKVIKRGRMTNVNIVGPDTYFTVMKQVQTLGERSDAETDQIIEQLKANKNRIPPPYIYELAVRLSASDPAEAFYYFGLASARARYDALRCTDRSARSGVNATLRMIGPRIRESDLLAVSNELEEQINRQLLESGELFSSTASPWWICSHGLSAMKFDDEDTTILRDEWLKPEADWAAAQKETRKFLGNRGA